MSISDCLVSICLFIKTPWKCLRGETTFCFTSFEVLQSNSQHHNIITHSWNNGLAMCADKKLASARSSCCGTYSDRDLGVSNWADILSEYHGERLTYSQNEQRCADWGRGVCDASRIGPFVMRLGHCLHRQSCTDAASSSVNLEANSWLWTTGSCDIKVRVDQDGLIAIFTNRQRQQSNGILNITLLSKAMFMLIRLWATSMSNGIRVT